MIRSIIGVVVGYIAMAAVVLIGFTAIQLALGTERVYEPASWMASTTFIAIALVVSLIAAVLGGLVCSAISRGGKAPVVLAGIVFGLGMLLAVMNLGKPAPGPRPAQVSPMESAQNARQPDWYSFTIPVLGAAGVMLGARMRRGKAA